MLSLMLVLQPRYAMADNDNAAIWGVAGAAGVVGVVLAALNLSHHWNKSENDSPGMLAKLVVTDPSPFTSGDSIPLSVTALDGDGNPIPDLVITWSASGSGTITFPSPPTSTTGPNGIATITATAALIGTVTVTAAAGDVTGSTTFEVETAGSAYSTSDIEITGGISKRSTGISSTAIASIVSSCPTSDGITGNDNSITESFYIVVYDQSGNPVPDVSVTWTATTATGDTGTAVFLLDGNLGAAINTTTDSSGTSTVTVMGQTKGNVTITATVDNSAITPATAILTVTLGLLDHIIITPTSPTIVSGSTQVFTATGYDCNKNEITGLSFIWGTTGGPGTITLSKKNDSLGQITATGNVAGSLTIKATATDPTNSSITKTGEDDEVTVTSSPTPLHISMATSSRAVASGSSVDITLTATDSSNNLIPSLDIALTSAPSPSSTASVIIPNNVTTESVGTAIGTATFSVTGSSAGSIIITATSGNASANLELEVTSGISEDIAITSTTGSLEVASGAGIPLTATVIDRNSNPVQGAYVKWTATSTPGSPGTATILSDLIKTDVNGKAHTTATGGVEGDVNITAAVTDSIGNPVYNASTQPITVTEVLSVNAPGKPDNISINFDITPVDNSKTTTARATVTDSKGNLVADGTTVDWAWVTYQNNGSVTLSGTSTTTSGGAAEIIVTGVAVGVVKIIATVTNSSGTTTKGQSLLSVNSGTPTTITIVPTVPAVTPITIKSGDTQQFAVTVTDGTNPLPGISIKYSITNSNPNDALSLSTYDATTDSSGKATLTATGKMVGTAYVTVTYSTTLSKDSDLVTVTPGAAKNVVLTIDNLSSSGTVVSSSTKQVSAKVTDVNGNLVADGTSVAWSSANTVVATVSPSSSTTSSGIATTTTTGLKVGSTSITATSNSISSTIGLSVTVGPVSTVAVTPATTSVISGNSATYTAKVTDANGNALKTYTIDWTTTTADTGTASLSGTTSSTDNSGNAIIQAVGKLMGNANIIATASTDSSKHGQGVLNISGPGSLSTISVSTTTPKITADDNTATFSLIAKDAAGNPIPGVSITWSITSNNGSNSYSLSTLTSTTDSSGLATVTVSNCYHTDTATIKATSGTVSGTATLAVIPGALYVMYITPLAAVIEVNNSLIFTVTALDKYKNLKSDVSVAWILDVSGVVQITAPSNTPPTSVTSSTPGTLFGTATATVKGLSRGVTALEAKNTDTGKKTAVIILVE